MNARRNYPLLLAGQFLSAYGDNFLLAAILGPLTFAQSAGQITAQHVSAQNALFSAVFFVPFILLAPVAGFLNDRYPKTTWLAGGNLIKLLGTAVGLTGILLHPADAVANLPWQVLGYTVVGIGACVYSPAKYGILPEIVARERLVKANGTVEMLTLVAILTGLGAGAVLYDHFRSLVPCYLASLAWYGLALLFNGLMQRTPQNLAARLRSSARDFGREFWGLVSHARLGRILLGCGIFWFAGAALRNNLQAWGLVVFREAGVALEAITNANLTLLKVGMVVGIVAGSLLAGKLHPVGDLSWARRYGLALAAAVLGLGLLGGTTGLAMVVVVLVAAGLFSGLLLVPLNAALQAETHPGHLGKTIAIQNFVDYCSMLVGAGYLGLLTLAGCGPKGMFLALAGALVVLSFGLRFARPNRSLAIPVVAPADAGTSGDETQLPTAGGEPGPGAFGDQAILAVILGQLTFAQNAGRITPAHLSGWNAIYSTLLFVPYVVLAPLVGYWNDRHPKTACLAGGNLIRLGGTALAGTSVWLGPAAQGLGYLLVGVGACVFSPAKYGILPEIVARERLVKANGLLEFYTIAAILAGFVAGATLVDQLPVLACYGVLLGIYAASLGLNLLMAPTPRHPEVRWRRSVDAFFGNLGQLLGHPRLFRVLCGLGLFWFCGAAIKMNFQPWGLNVLRLHEETVMVLAHPFQLGVNTRIALLGLWLSLGVMLGTMAAGALHRVGDLRGIRPYGWALAGLVALLGLADLLLGMGLAQSHGKVVVLLIATGTVAGLFLIPLTSTLQSESDPSRRGKTLAAMNFVDNLGMVFAGGVVLFAAQAGIGASGVFVLLGVAFGTAVVFLKVPRSPQLAADAAEASPPAEAPSRGSSEQDGGGEI